MHAHLVPPPSAAWRLDGDVGSLGGGAALRLHGSCNWTAPDGGLGPSLRLTRGCYASTPSSPSLQVGTGSLSVCARFRSTVPGASLLNKLGRDGSAGVLHGWGVELGEGRGLGLNFADRSGTSVHEEVGRAPLADGAWHHACVVLRRSPPSPELGVYIDGRASESVSLRGSRLARLGSLSCDAPLLVGRRAADDRGSSPRGAVREVAVWSRALLAEHVAALARDGLPPPAAQDGGAPLTGPHRRRGGGGEGVGAAMAIGAGWAPRPPLLPLTARAALVGVAALWLAGRSHRFKALLRRCLEHAERQRERARSRAEVVGAA